MTGRVSLASLALGGLVLFGFRPAQAQATPESGPRRGIGVALQGDDTGIRVIDLVPGSPAAKAGVKVGDQMISIAGTSVFDYTPDRMRALADTAKVITVVVMREGQKITFEIEPAVVTAAPADSSAPR